MEQIKIKNITRTNQVVSQDVVRRVHSTPGCQGTKWAEVDRVLKRNPKLVAGDPGTQALTSSLLLVMTVSARVRLKNCQKRGPADIR